MERSRATPVKRLLCVQNHCARLSFGWRAGVAVRMSEDLIEEGEGAEVLPCDTCPLTMHTPAYRFDGLPVTQLPPGHIGNNIYGWLRKLSIAVSGGLSG